MMNHLEQRITVSARTLEALNMRGYLKRDHESGLLSMSVRNYLVFSQAELATQHYYELGPDCSGPNQVVCLCEKCKERMGKVTANIADISTRQIVRDVTAHRKYA